MVTNRFQALMPTICEWLTANGITPGDVPIAAVPFIRDGQITCTVYARRADGQLRVDGTGNLVTDHVTVPLSVQPPSKLADWLKGRVLP